MMWACSWMRHSLIYLIFTKVWRQHRTVANKSVKTCYCVLFEQELRPQGVLQMNSWHNRQTFPAETCLSEECFLTSGIFKIELTTTEFFQRLKRCSFQSRLSSEKTDFKSKVVQGSAQSCHQAQNRLTSPTLSLERMGCLEVFHTFV